MTDQEIERLIEIAKKAHQEKWCLGGCSGRMITTPSGYVGDGFIADVDTKENASHIAAFDPPTVLQLLQEIKELKVDRPWQPIETAPKIENNDSPEIVVAHLQDGYKAVAAWDGDAWAYYAGPSEAWVTLWFSPTHWQPLSTKEGPEA